MRLSSEFEIILSLSPRATVFDDEMRNKAITTFKEGLLRLTTAKGIGLVKSFQALMTDKKQPGSRQIRR